jgi:hypothetical protein
MDSSDPWIALFGCLCAVQESAVGFARNQFKKLTDVSRLLSFLPGHTRPIDALLPESYCACK